MTTFEAIVVAGDEITLDLLVWRRFKRRTDRVVERILEADPDLGNVGVFLPVGTIVRIPIDAPSRTPPKRNAVRLWTS